MRQAIIATAGALLLLIAADAHAEAGKSPIPGLTLTTFADAMKSRGYEFSDSRTEPVPFVDFDKRINDTRYRAEMYFAAAESPRRINCSVTTTIDKQIDPIAVPELAAMAAAACGKNSDAAAKWVRDNIGANIETVIGGVRLKLDAPTKSGRGLTITAA